MNYPLDFIHIGLPKCASTYLQNVWNLSNQYNLLDISSVVQTLRGFACGDLSGDFPVIGGEIPVDTDRINIASSEGLVYSYTNQPSKQCFIPLLQSYSAKVLGEANLSKNIIIIVRNPVDWLRSMHEQSIKEGGHESFKEFLENQKLLVLNTLNFKHLITEFYNYFENVIVLSSDELRIDPQLFWNKYAQSLDIKAPNINQIKNQMSSFSGNKTLGNKIISLAKLNAYSRQVVNTFNALDDYKKIFPAEAKNLSNSIKSHWIWINRRLAEFSSEAQMGQISDLLSNESFEIASFNKVELDEDTANLIDKNYVEVLKNTSLINQEMIEKYKADLARSTIKEEQLIA